MKIIKAYKCEYCGKIYKSKAWAIKHELICRKNPKNYQPCFFCEFLEKKKLHIPSRFLNVLFLEGTENLMILKIKKKFFIVKKSKFTRFLTGAKHLF